MLIKDNKSMYNNDDIQEGDFEDSDGKPPTIKSVNTDSQYDENEDLDQVDEYSNTQESIENYSVEDQASIRARVLEEDDGFI